MLFTRKSSVISFQDAQRILVKLLNDVGEQHWAKQVEQASPVTFRGLCGGMGSLNDLILCRENAHKIEEDATPRANSLMTAMISICYETSQRGSLAKEELLKRCIGFPQVISGCRCQDCGHSFSGSRQILTFLAEVRLRGSIAQSESPEWPIASLLAYWNTPEPQATVDALIERLRRADIEYSPGDGWMRPCRACGSDRTCIYRWRVSDVGITPSDDNLPVKQKQANQAIQSTPLKRRD
ncbi:MAG: hypothetical protein PHC88_16120 [Terrimicrobiaceae bacterium]|nr:hypothetical protein [Terrimicrobiaceae bacterium]